MCGRWIERPLSGGGPTATLTPDHLYFEQDGPAWHDLRDRHYSVQVTVRVAELH